MKKQPKRRLIYSNFYGEFNTEEYAREWLFEEYCNDPELAGVDWESVNDIPDEMVWKELAHHFFTLGSGSLNSAKKSFMSLKTRLDFSIIDKRRKNDIIFPQQVVDILVHLGRQIVQKNNVIVQIAFKVLRHLHRNFCKHQEVQCFHFLQSFLLL